MYAKISRELKKSWDILVYSKFIFSYIHKIYYYFFMTYMLFFALCIYFYMHLPSYQNSLKSAFLSDSIDVINSSATKVLKGMVDPNEDFVAVNSLQRQVRIKNNKKLEALKFNNISSVFVVVLNGENLFYLLEAEDYDPADLLEIFDSGNIEDFKKVQETQKDKIFFQPGLENIGFTLIKPIIQEDEVVAFMLVDYTQDTFDHILSRVNTFIQPTIILFVGLMIILTILLIYSMVTIYKKYKRYKIPKVQAFYRSFLTDYYEQIAFRDAYIVLADIDRIKRINDLYGEEEGDHVIDTIMSEIAKEFTKDNLMIQYGGGEFLLLINKREFDIITLKKKIETIRQKIEALSFHFNNIDETVTLSIGVFLESQHISSLQSAIHNADVALYFAKHHGRNRICYFDISDEKKLYRGKLKKMIEDDQLVCHYQPIVNLHTGKYHHYEALLRITDGDSILYPDKILPDLEDSYFYSRMSMKVVEYNIEKVRKTPGLIVSINLSSDDLLNDAICTLLENSPDVAARMFIEILETKDMDYIEIEKVIQKLKKLGYKICIDDFGSGYANLEHLFRLSIDYLKLDGSIIKNIHKDHRAHTIIQAVVKFCQDNGIEVVAEYVENEQIVEVLKELGIVYGQGYYFDKPKPFEALGL